MNQNRSLLKVILTLLLLISSTFLIAQSEKTYTFTSTQVKQIAIELDHKRLLELDTADYKLQIRVLESQNKLLKENTETLAEKYKIKTVYTEILESDIEGLKKENLSVRKKNSALKKKLKVATYSVPICLSLGLIVGAIISN